MSETKKWLLGIICLVASIYAYKHLNVVLDAQPPKVPLQQWWGDDVEPTDWAAYLKNSSKVRGNKLMFPDEVSHIADRKFARTKKNIQY